MQLMYSTDIFKTLNTKYRNVARAKPEIKKPTYYYE